MYFALKCTLGILLLFVYSVWCPSHRCALTPFLSPKAVHGGAFRAAADSESAKRTEGAPPPRQEAAVAPSRQVNTSGSKPATAAGPRDSPAALKSNSKLNLKNAGWTCGECLHWLPDRETYVSHMKTNHGKVSADYSVPLNRCVCAYSHAI